MESVLAVAGPTGASNSSAQTNPSALAHDKSKLIRLSMIDQKVSNFKKIARQIDEPYTVCANASTPMANRESRLGNC